MALTKNTKEAFSFKKDPTKMKICHRLTVIENYEKELNLHVEEMVEVIELIKNKRIYPFKVVLAYKSYHGDVRMYNSEISEERQLTQDQFELIARVFSSK